MNRQALVKLGITGIVALGTLVAAAPSARAQDQAPQRSTKQQQGVLRS